MSSGHLVKIAACGKIITINMIKFFRRIRYDLMEQNKTGKYLKYAIGEIVLVVIGILIALQINNWNENKKSARLAETYIKDIRQDLIKDTIMFNAAIKRAKQTIAKNKAILNIKQPNSISKDSLYSMLTVFHSMRIYQINNSTYLKLLNTSFLDSNVFNNLFSSINTYYTKEYNTYSEYIEWDKERSIYIMDNNFFGNYKNTLDITSLLPEHSNHFNSDSLDKSINSVRKFIASNQFRNNVFGNYTRKESVVERLFIQKQLATKLLKEINNEIPYND
jgi:Family of unknown function (DUF6090)